MTLYAHEPMSDQSEGLETLLYYGRWAREDIFIALFTALIFLAVWILPLLLQRSPG